MLKIIILNEDEDRILGKRGAAFAPTDSADMVLVANTRVEYEIVKDRYGIGAKVIEALGDKPLDNSAKG